MTQLESVYAAGAVEYLIAAPILRAIAGLLLSISVAKDCKAKKNGSPLLWALFVLLMPFIAGIIYFVYSRYFAENSEIMEKDRRKMKSSKRLCFLAVIVYIASVIMPVISFAVTAAAGLTGIKNEEILFPYYDQNGAEYAFYDDVPLYDEMGNEYHLDRSETFWLADSYFDSQGKEYDSEKSFIDENGYFFYDENDTLVLNDDGYYYDASGKKYALIDGYVYWDEQGRINFTYGRAVSTYYAFE